MGTNKVILIGNLGKNPEFHHTEQRLPVCRMRLATSERRKNASGDYVEHTEWHTVVTFGRTAENCAQYLSKGRQVFVEGRLQTSKWQDKEGKDRYTTDIVAQVVQFLGGRSKDAAAPLEHDSETSALGSDDSGPNLASLQSSYTSAESLAEG